MIEFNDYLSKISNTINRTKTEEVLMWIEYKYSQLKPEFKWNQPMFTLNGTFIIAFSVASKHLSVAPERAGIIHFEEEFKLKKHDYSKMFLRFPFDKPFDYDLLSKMIEFNIKDKENCKTFWRK